MGAKDSGIARFALAVLLTLAASCGDGDVWLGDAALDPVDAAPLEASPGDARAGDDAGDDAAVAPLDGGPPGDGGSSDAAAQPDAEPGGGGPRLSVLHYDYTFDLKSARAESLLTLGAPAVGTGCTPLASKLPLAELRAESATPFEVAQQGSALTLCGSYRPDEPVTLSAVVSVPTVGDPTTGVGYTQRLDRHGSPFSYLLGWLEACDMFGPCDPRPATLSNFSIRVSHGPDDVVLCPGHRSAGLRSTLCRLPETLAPTYSAFAIAANPGWRSTPLVSAAGVDVVVFENALGSLRESLDAQAVGAFLVWLSELLGPFPYGPELRVASAPVSWLGMEHPANIVLREDLSLVSNLYANVPLHTLLHEIAHQWAGNRVTLASTLDYAWKEALAEYLVYRFEQQERPAEEAASTLKVWHATGNGAAYPVRPLNAPTVPLWVWSAGAYGSGPMTLFVQLEPFLGKAQLLGAIEEFLREPGARSIRDWQDLLERRSGHSLATYFNAWVYGRGDLEWPAFYVETQLLGAETQLKVTQTHGTRKRFPCVVELELRAAPDVKQRVQVDFGLEPLSTSKTVLVPFDRPVSGVRVDPDGKLLDWSLSTGQKARAAALPAVRFHP